MALFVAPPNMSVQKRTMDWYSHGCACRDASCNEEGLRLCCSAQRAQYLYGAWSFKRGRHEFRGWRARRVYCIHAIRPSLRHGFLLGYQMGFRLGVPSGPPFYVLLVFHLAADSSLIRRGVSGGLDLCSISGLPA